MNVGFYEGISEERSDNRSGLPMNNGAGWEARRRSRCTGRRGGEEQEGGVE